MLDAVAGVQRAYPDLYVAQAGQASGEKIIGEGLDQSLNLLSLLSIPISLGILLVAFGAIVAALLPIGLAVTAVVAAMGLLALASRAAPAADTTMHVMLLVGLAVGVDYCLFYIRREREERDCGADRHGALAIAAPNSGRSVWVSGLTVIVAMAGMFLTRCSSSLSFLDCRWTITCSCSAASARGMTVAYLAGWTGYLACHTAGQGRRRDHGPTQRGDHRGHLRLVRPSSRRSVTATGRSTTAARPRCFFVTEHAQVPTGSYDNMVKTKDTSPLEPKLQEHKYYARGISSVLVVNLTEGTRDELVRFTAR